MNKPAEAERQVVTHIDGEPFEWTVSGAFDWGEGDALYDKTHDKLRPIVGDDGYVISPLPAGFAENARDSIAQFLAGYNLRMDDYHEQTDDETHARVVSASRELNMRALGWDGEALCAQLGGILGAELSPHIADLGGDHVQVRINRPNSTDFNPPHRDGSLSFWRNTVNLWIPIHGCNEQTRLPVAPASHLIAERDCLQTAPKGAKINGKTYNVPAIICHRGGNWQMRRPPANFGEALIFTPYLVHGAAVNLSQQTRVSLELRLTVRGQNYAQAA
jgi:hypothetical protein